MSKINIINANFTNGREIVTRKIFQYDYGQKLKIKGINLPFIFQAHISNQKQNGTAKKVIGENNEISIPDEYLISGQDIYIFIVLHQALDDGETRYLIKIPVIKRSKSSDQQPTPVQQDVIENAISALNTAVEATEQNVKHYPKIIDNYWYVYDAQLQEYVNTNIHARGAQGQSAYQIAVKNGYQGTEEEWLLSFTRGEDGYTPIRGIDYWTEEDQNEIKTYIVNQMPTKISDLQNDTNYIDASGAPVQSVNNQTGNIVITAQSIGALTQHQDISGKANKSELSLVATSGSYNDLTNKPTIPSNVSELNNDSGYLITETDPTVPAWAKAAQKPTYTANEVGALPSTTYIPNKVSDLTNDENYQTDADVSAAIANAISQITGFDFEIVQELPASGEKGIIYLIAHSHGVNDGYDEYIWIVNKFERLGNLDIDLSGYLQTSNVISNAEIDQMFST